MQGLVGGAYGGLGDGRVTIGVSPGGQGDREKPVEGQFLVNVYQPA